MKKTCFFIGHKDAEKELCPVLYRMIEQIFVQDHVTTFYVGNYGRFDYWVGESVRKLKESHAGIKLFLVIPYHPSIRPIEAPPGYDGTYYPDGMESVHPKYAIMQANRKMIDSCDHLIAYVYHDIGNSYKVLEYARKREKQGLIQISNIGEIVHEGVSV